MDVADHDVDRELLVCGRKRRECIQWLSTHHIAAELILKIFGYVFANSRIDASEVRVLTAVERRIDYLLSSSGTSRLRELARNALWERIWIDVPLSIMTDGKEGASSAKHHLLEVQAKAQKLNVQCSEEDVLRWSWSCRENELYSKAPKSWIDQLREILTKFVAGPNVPMVSLRAIHLCMEVPKTKFSYDFEVRECMATSDVALERAVQVFFDAMQPLPYRISASLRSAGSRQNNAVSTRV